MRSRKACFVEVREHVFDSLFVVLILLLFLDLGSGWLSGFWVLQLAVPGLFNRRYSLIAEMEPALKLRSFLYAFLIFLFLLAAVLIIELLLSQMAKLKRDLNDLTKIHSGGFLARRIVEALVSFQLCLYEFFHRFEIILVKCLTDQV